MNKNQLIPHLFRTEFSKIVAVLCKKFGLQNIQLAEDIASDTFLKATETWGLKGIPKNPKAWLYVVAKNNTKDYFKREQIYTQKILPSLKYHSKNTDALNIDLSKNNIIDSQLKMLFAVCNPKLSKNNQLTLALRILCGFGIKEIATALLSKTSTVKKRLQRAKKTVKDKKIELKLPSKNEMINRLDSIFSVLYLLYNEGYYSTTSEKSVKKELCMEAMRLLYILLNYKPTNLPKANALMALFCFHSSRFDARTDVQGKPVLYKNQNKKKWNDNLINKGEFYLEQSANGKDITKYHLEALIAYWHTRKNANKKEKWTTVLQLYNHLIQIEYSPITALNRTYALAMVNGKKEAIKEALKINLETNHLYHSLLAELYHNINPIKEKKHLQLAIQLATTKNDKNILIDKLKLIN